ncbi:MULTISPECIES: ABC transporter ATP-binding protein [Eubacteriales]|uniref:ABC-2 type transport system ATP-binding protein n=1 Tax=Bittarella massiliensis (ex Durand et al. 2017) TaxID=1720313 RepID=A0AAQ1RVA9_9FIRM|nr:MULTISPECIES: ABC transporter ATP-binding protein [Eubacteriales]ERI99738.1 ABC transporter, ATP-binding protein [Clostridium sp. ATCC 29733]MZL70140.1 ATP-binding cassette domain-containing protein [Bittarella massiliensis (ex Durand et al. 2017)]MZL81156.1 ATP-binding cassette domain-containing protein [Bittarella massiliensis (ex Durand et al. 2017)]SHF83362.1 ABC-2 type transport system ATP-binding protein [Bittarella massiliensis (ex Durand et al. 2017)]
MLKIEHLTKVYKGGKKAVDDLSLEVAAGEIYGFIGHNGAGKTTTIKAAVGILDFEGGDIFIDGHSVKREPMACKAVTAYIPDNPDLYDHLTGIQYLNFVGDVFAVEGGLRRQRIAKYGDRLELTANLGDPISSYSHGMKQKLAIISALIHAPKLLVLDEPMVGLDPSAAFHLKQIMKELCAQGSTIFFSTHVLEVAEKLCDKIAIIKEGRLVVSGPTHEVIGQSSLEDVFLELIDHE